jgi:hypothetical protein
LADDAGARGHREAVDHPQLAKLPRAIVVQEDAVRDLRGGSFFLQRLDQPGVALAAVGRFVQTRVDAVGQGGDYCDLILWPAGRKFSRQVQPD